MLALLALIVPCCFERALSGLGDMFIIYDRKNPSVFIKLGLITFRSRLETQS